MGYRLILKFSFQIRNPYGKYISSVNSWHLALLLQLASLSPLIISTLFQSINIHLFYKLFHPKWNNNIKPTLSNMVSLFVYCIPACVSISLLHFTQTFVEKVFVILCHTCSPSSLSSIYSTKAFFSTTPLKLISPMLPVAYIVQIQALFIINLKDLELSKYWV